jgi:medium-chain acyl-[acyl-carrier-protein] hydrolase
MGSGRTLVFDTPYCGRVLVPGAAHQLICLPFPGAGASAYLPWAESLPSSVELCAVQLPGREDRFLEDPITSLPVLVEQISRELGGGRSMPYSLFGHSGGALLAYEVACALVEQGRPQPVRLFVSGENAPSARRAQIRSHRLPDAEFLEHVRARGGLDAEFLENEELVELVLPVLRADFTWYENYRPVDRSVLDCPITAFTSASDGLVDADGVERWRDHTSGSVDVHVVEGDHFFVWDAREEIITHLLEAVTSRPAS